MFGNAATSSPSYVIRGRGYRGHPAFRYHQQVIWLRLRGLRKDLNSFERPRCSVSNFLTKNSII